MKYKADLDDIIKTDQIKIEKRIKAQGHTLRSLSETKKKSSTNNPLLSTQQKQTSRLSITLI